MTALFTLATSCTEPDEDYTSPIALARALLKRRDAIARGAAPACVTATLSRSDVPCARVIAVRALDGSCNGKGALLGYAFMPGQDGLARLRQALADAAGVALGAGGAAAP